MVKKSGAVSTDLAHPEDVDQLTAKCVDAAKAWAPVAKEIWENSKGREHADWKAEQEAKKKAEIQKKVQEKNRKKIRIS
jgi:hypothetical protein